MVSAYATESNGLALVRDVLVKTFIGEAAVVSMVVLGRPPGLCKDLLISSLCQQSFFKGKVSHQMYIDKIADMVAKICRTPNPVARWEACHLRNQAGLGRDDLIDRSAVTWLNLVGLTDATTCFPFATPGTTMCLSELARDAKRRLVFAGKDRFGQYLPFGKLK